ncbi:MAG: hypothetical protein WC807_18445 [Hyphomicrobium sp.]|jgi:hypothetical protein
MAERNAFDQAFAELDAALIDIDGDGVPDVQVPRNALAGGQVQIPQKMIPQGAQPLAPGFEMLRAQAPQQQANALNARSAPMDPATRNELPPPAPPPPGGFAQPPPEPEHYGLQKLLRDNFGGVGNALSNYGNRIYDDVTSDPWGAAGGAVDFATGYGAGSGAVRDVMMRPFDKTMRGIAGRELRSYTESGARKNALEQVQIGARRMDEARDAFNSQPEVVLSRRPHWEVQGRGPKARFQKYTDEVRAARDRGIELRRREQEAVERAKKYNEGTN